MVVDKSRYSPRSPGSLSGSHATLGGSAMSIKGKSGRSDCPPETEHFTTVVIGGGQTGLTVGYYLAQFGQPFVIVDASERIGDSWRQRWDSLRLFTPACYDGLPGWHFPSSAWSFPTRNEMADYLQAYAARFDFTILSGFRVDRLSRSTIAL